LLSLAVYLLQAASIFVKLYDMFMSKDCTLLEINPIAEDAQGTGDANSEPVFVPFESYYAISHVSCKLNSSKGK